MNNYINLALVKENLKVSA